MRGKVNWTPELVEQARKLYWDEQKSPVEIVATLNLPTKPCSLWGIFSRRGIPRRSRANAIKLAHRNLPHYYTALKSDIRIKWTNGLVAQIKYMYIDLKMNVSDISKVIELKSCTIRAGLKRHGVPLRTFSESQKIAHTTHPESYCREAAPNWQGGRKVNKAGYILLLLESSNPFYSMAQKSGYIMEHRYIMAKHLGRLLELWEVVHHRNRNRADNRLENLYLYPSKEHKELHIEWKLVGQIKQLGQRVTLLEAENVLLKNQLGIKI